MKNMKIAQKLITSFLVIAVFTMIVGIIGIVGMTRISNSERDMYEIQTRPLPYLAKVKETLQLMRVNVREMIISSMTGDMAQVEAAFSIIGSYMPVMEKNLGEFRASTADPAILKPFDEGRSLYAKDLTDIVLSIYDEAKTGDTAGMIEKLGACKNVSDIIIERFDKCLTLKIESAAAYSQNSSSLTSALLVIIVSVLALALAVAVFFTFYISGLISKPIVPLTDFMKKAGSDGDLFMQPEEAEKLRRFSGSKDEIGQCIGAATAFVNRIFDVASALETVAGGDLTAELALLSAKDTLGNSLNKMTENLNNIFGEMSESASQVSIGSKQLADGAQSLAQGSTEQASAIQQLSATVGEVLDKTYQNAGIANEAANLSDKIRTSAEVGSAQMENMMQAVKDINEASGQIGKVIKVIDDIAFQTNILALNAAVEAARAGQHGKGFAVVAEEVRNLAAKSAEAAKDTGVLIEASIGKASQGLNIAVETSASLKEIVEGINRSAEIVRQIAKSSGEQSAAIAHINTGIEQVAQVVQQNSATAEESAAASDDMSGQSDILAQTIMRFKLRNVGSRRIAGARPAALLPGRV